MGPSDWGGNASWQIDNGGQHRFNLDSTRQMMSLSTNLFSRNPVLFAKCAWTYVR